MFYESKKKMLGTYKLGRSNKRIALYKTSSSRSCNVSAYSLSNHNSRKPVRKYLISPSTIEDLILFYKEKNRSLFIRNREISDEFNKSFKEVVNSNSEVLSKYIYKA